MVANGDFFHPEQVDWTFRTSAKGRRPTLSLVAQPFQPKQKQNNLGESSEADEAVGDHQINGHEAPSPWQLTLFAEGVTT